MANTVTYPRYLQYYARPFPRYPSSVGTLPPPGEFPATMDALRALTHTQLDTLAEFYTEEWGQNRDLLYRIDALATFIGSLA